ncbi:response regulator [Mariniflexile sp. AS56]|uniref:response regulator n=1 Tax=Mariniflexile sp. AS56 TaxID=3063957 RepID=UPI0026F2D2DC|nr:response regulator [Mariniflexile sp. AS56]MDO7174012.1 response regulator [Mariniflexile sp. AS56]
MEKTKLHLLLADDDIDDCDFFKDALDEIGSPSTLTTVNNGVELINFLLSEPLNYPDLIFLDLNMPRKSGIECIEEIKAKKEWSQIPIIIYSTSLDRITVNSLYELGAHYYIQKPSEFSSLKMVIKKALNIFSTPVLPPRSQEHFIIQP